MNAVNQVQEASAVYAVEQHALLKSFDLLATAPDGVARLRELILSLAVQGKLVPQDSSEEPASVLLERIRAEKQKLIKEGKLKKEKSLPDIGENDKSFELPDGWVWSRLDWLSPHSLTDGDWIESKDQDPDGEVRLVQLADVGDGEFKDKSNRFVTTETFKKLGCTELKEGDILIARLPSPIGRACIFPGLQQPAITAVDVAICRTNQNVNKEYLATAINSPVVRRCIESYGKGATRFRVSTGHLKNIPIALPPLQEQSRIVARVEELMQLCDALEAKGKLEAAQHARLVGALLDALANSESAHALAENWQRVAASFDLLFDRPEAVDALEQTLLQLAVRGLLVPQDPEDEPASELLKKIRAEKDHLIATGKLKRDKPLLEISEEEKPFELPRGWTFTTFSQLGRFSGGKTPSTNRGEYWNGDIPWVTPKDMKSALITTAQDKVSEKAIADGLAMIPPRSVLIVARSGILRRTVPVAITEISCTVNQDLKALELTIPQMAEYVQLMVMGFEGFILENLTKIGTTVESLRFEDFERQVFPLPPLAEQSRIVARVAELRQLCADLRARLTAARATQTRLAEALVEQAA